MRWMDGTYFVRTVPGASEVAVPGYVYLGTGTFDMYLATRKEEGVLHIGRTWWRSTPVPVLQSSGQAVSFLLDASAVSGTNLTPNASTNLSTSGFPQHCKHSARIVIGWKFDAGCSETHLRTRDCHLGDHVQTCCPQPLGV